MRISDWSSDVCSSDLRVKASAVAPAKPAMTLFLPRRRTLRALDFITVLPKLTWPSPATTTWLPLRTERIVEIGRASCRERVCQYVSISWDAVSLKKKKTQDNQ